ncbi:MAG: hypothetical protein ACKV19_13355 [Verrucomicrobiales bacterium]
MTPCLLMPRLVALALVAAFAGRLDASPPAADQSVFIVVNGAAGEETYADVFAKQVSTWAQTAAAHGGRALLIGQDEAGTNVADTTSDRSRLEQALGTEPKEGNAPLWLILIGHGTFDKKSARFNLRGDDVTATELATWLQPFQRPLAIINTASASAPFLNALSGPGRIVITATRSGNEQNYARFGSSLATALADPTTDLDQDSQVSLLEAFLIASNNVEEFYRTEGRLTTEHALIDDNGDGLGTPASWFRGLRAVKKPRDAAALDGARSHQWLVTPDPAATAQPPEWRLRRDTLEAAVTALREKKDSIPPDDYYQQLESALLELARHYEQLPAPTAQ